MQIFTHHRQTLISAFKDILSVHFSFDLWVSGNHLSLLGIVGHWINKDGQACRALLGLRRLHGAHTGENQSQVIMSLLQEYDLTKKIGYFTLDNAQNNDSALTCLAKHLQEIGVSFDVKEHRLRCIGHVINLVVKAFLYGIESDHEMPNLDEPSTFWRRQGSYGKLRNIINYICWTPQRRDEFIRLTQESSSEDSTFQPIAANLTRWNSDFKAIKRALQLQNGFEVFQARHIRDGLEDDQLDTDDWKELQDIATILEPFHRCTLELEGHRGNGVLYDLLPTMDYLLVHLESTLQLYKARKCSPHLLSSITLAWRKLEKYYRLTDENIVLYAAVVLHPSMKFDYFETSWAEHPAWITSAKAKVQQSWETM